MSNTLQTFLAAATRKAAGNVVTAVLNLPEDRRTWKPAETSRTALDQFAECAMNNGFTADIVEKRVVPFHSQEDYLKQKTDLVATGFDAIKSLLDTNTERMIAVILAFPDSGLTDELDLPWGKSTLAEILAYPYWNMAYHEGQINYIASLLSL